MGCSQIQDALLLFITIAEYKRAAPKEQEGIGEKKKEKEIKGTLNPNTPDIS